MAGSLQARATKYDRDGGVEIQPDVCPMPGQGVQTTRACTREWRAGDVQTCVYCYAFTEHNDPTERITTADMELWMASHANAHKRVRVLCLAAKPVDRAGA